MGGGAGARTPLVAASASIQPGKPFTVALRFVHDPHWHTYWTNPGTGLATSLTWTLPPGFTASDIQWPAPHVLTDHTGTVIGNGSEGDLFLPVTITPPADTGITTATESIGENHVTATRTWVDGTVALQRERYMAGPTYNKTTTSATFGFDNT